MVSTRQRVSDPEWCRTYEDTAGISLLPVGGQSHMTLFVDTQGAVWGGFDAEYGQLGATLDEVVHDLLVRPRPRRRLDRHTPPVSAALPVLRVYPGSLALGCAAA